MRKDDLKYMPKTRALLGNKGMRFENAYVSLAWCCPSRATIMCGQYARNHGLWFTQDTADGGWQGYKNLGYEEDNIATHLQDAGYRTGYFGKYLNFYDDTTTAPRAGTTGSLCWRWGQPPLRTRKGTSTTT
jgi:N-acetylglucosamine-6-sulfatase